MAARQGERTERPTGRRLREARKKGQIARSRDLSQVASLAAALLALSWLGKNMVDGVGRAATASLRAMSSHALGDLEIQDVTGLVAQGGLLVAELVGPVAGAVMVAVVGIQTLQGGWLFTVESLKLDVSRLSPMTGLRRLAPSRAGLDLVKVAVVVVALTLISQRFIGRRLADAERIGRVLLDDALAIAWSDAQRLIQQALVVLVLIAVIDYALQRWRHMRALRMTKQEVKDDMRHTEGNPETKSRVRRIQREMARRRMLADTKKATVVITNPTEYAVALQFERHVMPAPRVVAKGRGFLAARIKAVAREHGVPLVENVPLAQALYRGAEVGDIIPPSLFEAVAEVLAYLVRLKQIAL